MSSRPPAAHLAVRAALAAAERDEALPDAVALELASVASSDLVPLIGAAGTRRDRHYGKAITFSPKAFLPVTNLCRNQCDYCAFRRSPGQAGAWTMSPEQIVATLDRARQSHCAEALLCLGDQPETAFAAYRDTLGAWGHASTVDYLVWASERALERGLLPHTNAGVLGYDEMRRLRRCNVSLGLMLENVSERLCQRGGPHHRAPDKRPARRLSMLRDAGELEIPFTTGILIGIGETPLERVETLLAIRNLHRRYGHVQEVIVQNFTPHAGTPLAARAAPSEDELLHAVALARLLLDPEVGVQAPPNLNPTRIEGLLAAGINDFGGISPVTRDYINPEQPWPELAALQKRCREAGFELSPRLSIYPAFASDARFLDPALNGAVDDARRRLERARLLPS
jgi:7,8-didemethyl-8-hydroxy-5-deazariboflavin synthase CofG subunit